jgi:hypothetical protein
VPKVVDGEDEVAVLGLISEDVVIDLGDNLFSKTKLILSARPISRWCSTFSI